MRGIAHSLLLACTLLLGGFAASATEIAGTVLVNGHPATAKLQLTTLEGRLIVTPRPNPC